MCFFNSSKPFPVPTSSIDTVSSKTASLPSPPVPCDPVLPYMIPEPLLLLFSPRSAMSLSENSRRNSLRPTFLYSPSTSRSPAMRNPSSPPPGAGIPPPRFLIQAPSEPSKVEMYPSAFYAACIAGGIASCGITHMAVIPVDLVKCNMQIIPAKYKSISSGFGILLKEQGPKSFFRGWVPTLFGYSAQGACKFGFYKSFKKYYSDIAGPEYASKYKNMDLSLQGWLLLE